MSVSSGVCAEFGGASLLNMDSISLFAELSSFCLNPVKN